MAIDLKVNSLSGALVATVNVEPHDSIAEVLKRLRKTAEEPPEQQASGESGAEPGAAGWKRGSSPAAAARERPRLVFGDRVLLPWQSVQACGLSPGDAVSLVRVPRTPVQLNLFYNLSLGNEGLAALAAELPEDGGCPLRALDVGRCGLGGVAGAEAIAAIVRRSEGLEELVCTGNVALRSDGILALAARLASGGGGGGGGSGGAAASTAAPLKSLSVSGCGLAGAEGGHAVAKLLSALPCRDLNLFSNPLLETRGVRALMEAAQFSSLQSLDVGFCGLGGAEGGALLAELCTASLTDLSACGNRALQNAGVAAMADHLSAGPTCLKVLELEHCGLDGAAGGRAIGALLERAGALEELSLSDNSDFGLEGVTALAACIPQDLRLSSLHLARTGLSAEEGGSAVAALAARLRRLEELSLLGNGLGPDGLESLARQLAEGLPLRSLDLTSCGLWGAAGAAALCAVVRASPGLHILSISGNAAMDAAGVGLLADRLSDEPLGLKALHIGSCGLAGAPAGHALARLLARLPELDDLDLLANEDFGAEGLAALASGLPAGCGLHCVECTGCGLRGLPGGEAAAALVRAAPGLEILGLSDNDGLGAAGLGALARALPAGRAELRRLDLEDCGLEGVEGGRAVAAALQAAPLLQHLGLAKNEALGTEGLGFLLRSLQLGSQLSAVDVGDCGLTGCGDGAALGAALLPLLAP